jgi:predicted glycosyltransferase
MKRVLIYSHDTFGLGNIRRMLEVARHLVESSSRVSVLVITGSPMLHAFRIPAGIDYVKLPCLQRDVEGHYAARSLNLSLHETVRLRANLIRSTLSDFQPDLVLVDKKPFGVEDELAGTLQALREQRQRPKLVLLLRDILDSPQATARIWRKNGYFEAITTYYDQVLVVGCPQVFDMRREYEFPPFAAARVRYCGYIAREAGRQTRSEMRQALGVSAHERLLLVTPGGGEDGYALVDTALRGLAQAVQAGQATALRMHIVCGPEMGAGQRQAVLAAAQALPGVSVQDFSDDMMSLQAAADVVLAMGGYNTVCELLSCGKRAVLVPRIKPGQEQLIRAERMARLGLLAMVHPEQLDPARLMQAVRAELQALARGEPRPRLADLRGLPQTTAAIFEHIGIPHERGEHLPLPSTAARAAAAPRLVQ